MSALKRNDIVWIYDHFTSPLSRYDCGKRCAPHNEGSQPFCCDTRHAVPTAYAVEWDHLRQNTRMWHPWQGETEAETVRLAQETPPGQVLIECQGYLRCQRGFRSITCRAFPFFPYVDSRGDFLGLAYYWEYRERCWIISHLGDVTQEYIEEFFAAYERLFACLPEEKENFNAHSAEMRRIYTQSRRRIHILGRDGKAYAISPRREIVREIPFADLPSFGIYTLIAALPFPDEPDYD